MENLLAVDVGLLTRQSVVRAEGFYSGPFLFEGDLSALRDYKSLINYSPIALSHLML